MKKYIFLVSLFVGFCFYCKAKAAEKPCQINAVSSIAEQKRPSIPFAKSVVVEPVKEIPHLKSVSSVQYVNQKVDGLPISPRSPNDSPSRVRKPVKLTMSQDCLTTTKEDK